MKPLKDSQLRADREQVIAAFRQEGLSEQQADDATDAARFAQADDLQEAVPKFLRERPWFRSQQETASPYPDDWPTDASGRRLALHELTDDELARLAGERPEPQPTKLPTYSEAELDAMTPLERDAARVAMAGEPAKPDLSYQGVPSIEESREEMRVKEELRKETVASMKAGGLPFDPPRRKWGKS